MGKAVPGERRRSNQIFDGKSLGILRVCIVSWKATPFPQSNVDWENKLVWFEDFYQYWELDRIDGQPMEFECRNTSRELIFVRVDIPYLPGSETKWNATDTFKPGGEWDRVAELMMINFSESGHPMFRSASALERGTWKSKGGGKLTIHFCGDYDTVEVIFRTIVSVNQLSIYGAVADLCKELGSVPEKPVAGPQKRVDIFLMTINNKNCVTILDS